MSIGLVIIDVQNDYFTGGAMELVGMEEAAGNCAKLLGKFRESGNLVCHIQHLSNREGATFFMPGTEGCDINGAVAPLESELIVHKHFPNSFQKTTLKDALDYEKVDELVICGAMTQMCIDTTVRAAFELGYKCTLIGDACATRDLVYNDQTVKAQDVQIAFLASIGGVFASVVTTEEYLK